ncbi:MAG: NYN domain-containing protein [Bifidobacteriaceae bacterium]|jgi:uncharacterized LabA/DUF88 family protein|nr:NYN domain-containing protein [Bifidobacteriaceae bacterium]
MRNICFIDGQNLNMGTTTADNDWKIDLFKFRPYLRDKYCIEDAFYFLGFYDLKYASLYKALTRAGFQIRFREHDEIMYSMKKGNVDTDVVYEIMWSIAERDDFDKIILVSGDGDYIKAVRYAIQKNKFGKILFPSHRNTSSLYRRLSFKHKDYLDREPVRNIIEKRVY